MFLVLLAIENKAVTDLLRLIIRVTTKLYSPPLIYTMRDTLTANPDFTYPSGTLLYKISFDGEQKLFGLLEAYVVKGLHQVSRLKSKI